MRWLNVNDTNVPSEDAYYQLALMELGGDTPSWYGLIDVSQGYVYSNIKVIVDGFTKPSESDVNAKVTELKNSYASAQYKRDRAKAYPSTQEQLDMQYWDKVNGTTTWQDAIAKVKTDIPKE
jgi:hypothetical protein